MGPCGELGFGQKPQFIFRIKYMGEDLKGLEKNGRKVELLPIASSWSHTQNKQAYGRALILRGWSLDCPFLELKSCTNPTYTLFGIYGELKLKTSIIGMNWNFYFLWKKRNIVIGNG